MSSDFFQNYVVPAYEEWRRDPSNIRLAKVLASELNNVAENYWQLNRITFATQIGSAPNAAKFRDYLTNQLPEFGLVRDIADSHKHLFLDRRSAQIRSDNDIVIESVGFGQAYGLRYGGGDIVAVKLDNGETAYFEVISEAVYQYWKALLT